MATAADIRQSRVFDGLTEGERDAWLARATTVTCGRGQTLARQGDPAKYFYIVESGYVKILQLTADGTELIVRFVSSGEPFGGVVALSDAPYPVTAVIAQAAVIRQWTRQAMADLLATTPQVRVNIMREMTAHMTDALTRVRELATESVGQRLAHTLLRLARHCGETRADGVLITQPLTRQELADLTGTTLYTVSRTLSEWETMGLIASQKRVLLLRSTKKLERLAGGEE